MAGSRAWPPTKEDLERLYLVEHLSAAKIAKEYGLEYKTPKVAESVILYQLRKNGIQRRSSTEHVEKVTSDMVDEWVKRYEGGESLKQIAEGKVSPVTVFLHLRKRGMKLRDKVEAQIKAVSKHERKPFADDAIERAYLVGLRYGDLNAVKHGRGVRVRVSTTHSAMADLFYSLFQPYGYVHRYPREAKLTGYEWTLECDLDSSFGFLIEKPTMNDLGKLRVGEFLSFLAGFFDAEGSIYIHRKSRGHSPEIQIRNKDGALLSLVQQRLVLLGVSSKLYLQKQNAKRFGTHLEGDISVLSIWRFHSVRRLLDMTPLRHQEKVAKGRIARHFGPPSDPRNLEQLAQWGMLCDEIEKSRIGFIEDAKTARITSSTNAISQ
jgi:intein-encoded DNA endonuclease-like protein